MCRPRKEKIDWEKELPAWLLPPLQEVALPQLDMLAVVNVQNIGDLTDSEDSSSSLSSDMEVDNESLINSPSSDSEMEENEDPLVISSCLNNPEVVWPSDTDSAPSSESEEDDSHMEAGNVANACEACGGEVACGCPGPSSGQGHSCPGINRGGGRRGRNFARRSRPFFGKINQSFVTE